MIVFEDPFEDTLPVGVLCSVYKARYCRGSDLGKKEMSLRHKRTKAT